MKKIGLLLFAFVLVGQGCLSAGTQVETGAELDIDSPTQQDVVEKENDGNELPSATVEVESDTEVEAETGDDTETSAEADTETKEEPMQVTISEVGLTSGNFFFEPSTIRAQAGQEVEVTFVDNDGFHTFVIDILGVSHTIRAGESVTFTMPEESGSHPFYCSVSNHRQLGMEGTLIVE